MHKVIYCLPLHRAGYFIFLQTLKLKENSDDPTLLVGIQYSQIDEDFTNLFLEFSSNHSQAAENACCFF